MKRAAFTIVAVLSILMALAVPPARANGTEHGAFTTVQVSGLPDVCPTDMTMEGKLSVAMSPTAPISRVAITVQVVAVTPFGEAVLQEHRARIMAGQSISVPIEIPVTNSMGPGTFRINFVVTSKLEQITVPHDVRITRGM
jgi:hypothetical protein